jgi:FkbM family methyltransferase
MLSRVLRNAVADPRYLPARLAQAAWQVRSKAAARGEAQGDGEVLCRALGRYDLLVSEADVGLGPFLIRDGSWELWIARFLRRRIRPGMVCLDAGANLGYFTVLMADAAGPAGRVIAAEPVPATRSLLERNVDRNGFAERVEVLGAALGATSGGEVTLIIPEGEPKNAIVQPEGIDYSLGRPCIEVRAPAMRVDDLDLPRLDFVKIDVESAEAALWEGMQDTLARSPDIQIVMEVNCARTWYPREFISALEARFPLRAIDTVGNLHPISARALIEGVDDTMLYLARR